jgi:hypothetical protein
MADTLSLSPGPLQLALFLDHLWELRGNPLVHISDHKRRKTIAAAASTLMCVLAATDCVEDGLEPRHSLWLIIVNGEQQIMKVSTIGLAICLALMSTASVAQNNKASGVTGDPAASSQNANPDTTGMSSNKSGNGTSTSGGSDANGDQGRDKMPESNMKVKPSPGKPDIPNPGINK